MNGLCSQGMSFLEFAIADDLEKKGRCSFGLAGDGFLNAHIAWIFQKNSPVTPLVNTRCAGCFIDAKADNSLSMHAFCLIDHGKVFDFSREFNCNNIRNK